MWTLKEGEQPYKAREGESVRSVYFCSNFTSNALVFELAEQCRKTLLHHATRLLPICIFLDFPQQSQFASQTSVRLSNLSLMPVPSCFRLGFVLLVTVYKHNVFASVVHHILESHCLVQHRCHFPCPQCLVL